MRNMDALKLGLYLPVFGNGFLDELPEISRVVEFAKMAQLMDDDVIRLPVSEERDLVIEVEVSGAGAASPSALLILY